MLLGISTVRQVRAQTLIVPDTPGTRINLLSSDATILDAREVRKDLPCTVTGDKPELGFDLKFHASYEVTIPMRDLNGGEDVLTMVFRVTPEGHANDPVYFSQKIAVPKLDPNIGGQAYLTGNFVLGEGKYQVDWLMRDRAERVCSDSWSSTATLSARERGIQLAIPPGSVEPSDPQPFRMDDPVPREHNGLTVKVLINFAPQRFAASSLQPLDTAALLSVLRNISRERRISKFTIVAFNMQEQRVFYRKEGADQIDFPELGRNLNDLKLGTVHVSQLSEKHSDTDFLTHLLLTEMSTGHPDAVIFAGPKVLMEQSVPSESVKSLTDGVTYPVFYMNYNLAPHEIPWRDAIGSVVKRMNGHEYTISRPPDLWNAWSDIMSHIVKSRVPSVAVMSPATR